jgi:hypothetical protein
MGWVWGIPQYTSLTKLPVLPESVLDGAYLPYKEEAHESGLCSQEEAAPGNAIIRMVHTFRYKNTQKARLKMFKAAMISGNRS